MQDDTKENSVKIKIRKWHKKWKVTTPSGVIVFHTFEQAVEAAGDLLEHKKIHKGGKL